LIIEVVGSVSILNSTDDFDKIPVESRSYGRVWIPRWSQECRGQQKRNAPNDRLSERRTDGKVHGHNAGVDATTANRTRTDPEPAGVVKQ
jgi:hypothetical protein